jgi:hypothetical protein
MKNNDLSNPTTNLQEILYTLIFNGRVSLMDFPYLSGFRTRVSELLTDYSLVLESERVKAINKFGNRYSYVVHILNDNQLEQAFEIYQRLKKNQNG